MTNQKIFQVGTAVKGTYFGQDYRGVVVSGRCHTMNRSYEYTIDLDAPITVYGADRGRILVSIWEPTQSPTSIEEV